jgi:amidase
MLYVQEVLIQAIQVNCLSEIFFPEALEAAKDLDACYAASGQPQGILHGLPVSLKDCFRVRGTDAIIRYTAWADLPSSTHDESEMTKIMRDSGAILFCKTNVPLALMVGEVGEGNHTWNDVRDD